MQGKQEGGGPQGSGLQASLPFLPRGNKRWVSRKHSRRNASLAPSTSGKGGSPRGNKSLIMGAEMLVPVGEEGYWYQTRLGVRAEPLGPLSTTVPHSLCICLLPQPAALWQLMRMVGSLLLSHQLEHGAEDPSEGLGHPFSLAGKAHPILSGEKSISLGAFFGEA